MKGKVFEILASKHFAKFYVSTEITLSTKPGGGGSPHVVFWIRVACFDLQETKHPSDDMFFVIYGAPALIRNVIIRGFQSVKNCEKTEL